MLKEVLASNGAKLLAACVCPVVGVSAVALNVPKVRAAVHRATAPKDEPHRETRVPPKLRPPEQLARRLDDGPPPGGLMCAQPINLSDRPLELVASAPVSSPIQIDLPQVERVYVPSACPSVGSGNGGMMTQLASVPEPATWAQMVLGFALLGGVVRAGRRREARSV